MGSPVTIPNPAPGCSYLNYPRAVLNTPHPVYGGNLAGFGVGDLPTQFESGVAVFTAITANATSAYSEEWMVASGATREKIAYEPLGVICNISAWNYPYLVGTNVFVPALLAGNAVIYKPSAQGRDLDNNNAQTVVKVFPEIM